jgi:hypothetical protein
MFQINRVNYDFKEKKLSKDNSRFEFDQTIYLDLFLKCNEEKALKHKLQLDQMKEDLKILKETYSQYMENGDKKMYDLADVLQTCENLVTGNP